MNGAAPPRSRAARSAGEGRIGPSGRERSPRLPDLAAIAIACLLAAGCGVRPSDRSPAGLLEGVTLAPRGHVDLVLTGDGDPRPLFAGEGAALGLCLTTEPRTDSSQWEARLWFDRGDAEGAIFRGPSARMGTTLCFDTALPEDVVPGEHRLCAEIRDRFDGRTGRVPCLPVTIAEDLRGRERLESELHSLLARRGEIAPDDLLRRLDALHDRAAARGFPLLALRARLIAAWLSRRAGGRRALARAGAALAEDPPWIAHPAASHARAQLAYERAVLALEDGARLERAWRSLLEAEASYRRIADPRFVTVAMKQAEILARVGAGDEARLRLRAAIADGRALRGDPRALAAAENTLAWLLMTNPDADEADLAQAERILRRALDVSASADTPLERANEMLNLAFLNALRGEDPASPLTRVRALLAAGRRSQPWRARMLESWALLVEAAFALEKNDPDAALAACRRVTATAEAPRLAAWGASCAARALRLRGELDRAADAIERALLYHENANPRALGMAIAPGPGRMADDFYRAARLAVERDRPADAWRTLQRLDELLARRQQDSRCSAADSERFEQRRRELLLELLALEVPASGARRAQRASVRRALLRRLQDLVRREASCREPAAAVSDAGVRFRAVPLDDEVLLLERGSDGRVVTYRRTPLPRRGLVRLVDRIAARLESPSGEADSWRALVGPLAAALVPRLEDLDAVSVFALHGALQGVPLEALPVVPDGERGGAGAPPWLSDLTVVACHPAGVSAGVRPRTGGARSPLFVVDPGGNLPGARALASFYRAAFEGAVLLEREAATREALVTRLPAAAWLHVDAHAWYDPAFPELSSLRLADGPLTAGELVPRVRALRFANLSACGTGRWPVTADSGRYGLAGALAGAGVPWVVGSRANLSDALAGDFNRALYGELRRGRGFVDAYAEALRTVRARYPVDRWASLLLLRGAGERLAGQSPGRGEEAVPPDSPAGRGTPARRASAGPPGVMR